MSRLPSFKSVSSGVTQFLQQVLFPQSATRAGGGWDMKSVVSNVDEAHFGTLYASNLVACNISGSPGTIGNRATGVAIAGDGSDQGNYTSNSVTGFGTDVLGLNAGVARGTMSNLVLLGRGVASLACNLNTSVLIGNYAAVQADTMGGTIAIGDQAVYSAGGSNNVYLGTQSGYYARGSGNVFIGSLVGSTTAESNYVNRFLVGNSNSNFLLNGNFATGQLGVNCVPGSNFDVSGNTYLRNTTRIDTSLGINCSPTSNLDVSGTTYLRNTTRIDTSLGLNIAPVSTLDVSGTTRLRGNVVIDGDLTVSGGPIGSDVCTGQVVLGIGASLSTYPSLIAVKGGLQVSEGYIQINRTEFPFQYPLDVSGNARITGSNLIGGVTLSSSNVFTTGTISGVFSNGVTTSNTIGGITLGSSSGVDRIRLNASGSNSGGQLQLFNASGADTVSIFGSSFGDAGAIYVSASGGGTTNRIAGLRMDNANAGGYLFLNDRTNTANFEVFGSNGRISNLPSSSNSIGGLVISNSNVTYAKQIELRAGPFTQLGRYGYDGSGGYLTLNDGTYGFYQIEALTSPTETQFNIYGPNDTARNGSIRMFGSSGRISNLASSSNSIGGVTLGPDGAISGFGAILVGCIVPYAGGTSDSDLPPGWLGCDGRSLPTASYTVLFSRIGYTYGGSGSSFNIPNLRGRFPLGDGSSGGSTFTRGTTAGAETHTLTISEMPSHFHANSFAAVAGGDVLIGSGAGKADQHTCNTQSTGGGLPHENMPPYIVLGYIIRVL